MPNFNKLIRKKIDHKSKAKEKSFKLSKPLCLDWSLNKKRCCQKSNRNKSSEVMIVNIWEWQTRGSFITMISKEFIVQIFIFLQVWDKDKQQTVEFTIGEEGGCLYCEAWPRFSVKLGDDLQLNSNRPKAALRAFANVLMSMKRVRKLSIQCKQ